NERLRLSSEQQNVYEVLGSWSGHVRSSTATPHPRLLVIRYEDMLAAPAATFGRLAKHLGHDLAPDRLTQAIENSSFKVVSAQEAASGFNERSAKADRFFRSGRSGTGRETLSRAQIRRIANRHGAIMQQIGYSY